MTKKDIVRSIAEQIQQPQLRTKDLVQRTFDALIETLVRDGKIELRNFGVFQIKQRKARMARNPRTGARVPVEAKNVVTFKPGKKMEEMVKQYSGPARDDQPSNDGPAPSGSASAASPGKGMTGHDGSA